MDAEVIKLVVELLGLLASVVVVAMRLGSLKTSLEDKLGGLEKRVGEMRAESQSERAETRGTLSALKDGQVALQLTQNGDHILLGRLDAAFGALKEHADKSLLAQREELERTKATVSEIRRDVDRLQGRTDRA